jgi:hypothetical protein
MLDISESIITRLVIQETLREGFSRGVIEPTPESISGFIIDVLEGISDDKYGDLPEVAGEKVAKILLENIESESSLD